MRTRHEVNPTWERETHTQDGRQEELNLGGKAKTQYFQIAAFCGKKHKVENTENRQHPSEKND